ncbi:Dephospho-CoA kinase [Sulfitobacter noctilucae]|uniref:dephospho-CoA kinase n=1 Tax=Sulfitobacter noctilucae TaxID=1342302 RepID=UPI00055EEFF4|nr:dephospho-CoA kinase [Sulfitobacter noctilucae]KIN65751.1 Dephospho-CoA kinase [Sulfitobacter noctilucae]
MFLLGLTGSIGMGKSTTAKMFEDEGCALWDADAAVHRLYGAGGAAVEKIGKLFPDAVADGAVSTAKLREIIAKDETALKTIEGIVHPLVGQDRVEFLNNTKADIIVLDIPLLFETGGEGKVDAVVCVLTDDETQKERVMARGVMTETQFELIRSKQLPAATKAERADYVINTDTMDQAREQVRNVVRDIREKLQNA